MTTYAIYTRISADKGLGTTSEGLAVERQEASIRAVLKAKGLTVGKLYCDNSFSATDPKKPRPAYIQMMQDWEAGQFQGIAAYDLDRLTRTPREIEDVIDAAEARGLLLATVSGDADLSTDNGRLFARIKAAVAKAETERRGQRQKAKFAQDREQGKNHWRGRRPFGLELDGSLNAVEAEAIRAVTQRIIEGAPLNTCVAWLNEQEIFTTFGNPWKRTPLKRTLLHPRIIGKMEHHGELVPGNWKAVLDEATWKTLGAVLLNRPAKQTKNTSIEYVLSGVATCGRCGANAYGARVSRKTDRRAAQYVYRCGGEAGHFSRALAPTDQYVIDSTLSILMMSGAEDAYRTEGTTATLKELQAQKVAELGEWEQWLTEAAEEGLKPSEYRKPKELHQKRLAALEAQILDLTKTQVMDIDLEAGTLVSHFDELPLERRRNIISAVWSEIRIMPVGKGGRWSAEHIELIPTEQTKEVMDNVKALMPVHALLEEWQALTKEGRDTSDCEARLRVFGWTIHEGNLYHSGA